MHSVATVIFRGKFADRKTFRGTKSSARETPPDWFSGKSNFFTGPTLTAWSNFLFGGGKVAYLPRVAIRKPYLPVGIGRKVWPCRCRKPASRLPARARKRGRELHFQRVVQLFSSGRSPKLACNRRQKSNFPPANENLICPIRRCFAFNGRRKLSPEASKNFVFPAVPPGSLWAEVLIFWIL